MIYGIANNNALLKRLQQNRCRQIWGTHNATLYKERRWIVRSYFQYAMVISAVGELVSPSHQLPLPRTLFQIGHKWWWVSSMRWNSHKKTPEINELETDYKILKILAHNFEKRKSFSILKFLGWIFSEYFNVFIFI